MSDAEDLLLIVGAQDLASEVLRGIESAMSSMGGAGDAILGAGLALEGIGLAADAIIGKTLDMAASWQKTMTELQNNTGLSDQQIQEMNTTIRTMGDQSGASFEDLSAGMMHAMNISHDMAVSTAELNVAQ